MAAARVKLRAVADGPGATRARLDELTARRAGLLEQREIILAAPVPLAEAAPFVGKVIEGLKAQIAGERFGAHLAHHPQEWPAVADDLGNIGRTFGGSPPRVPVAALLAAVAPDALKAWLEGELAAAYANVPAPIDAATRAARLAALEREIAEVEREVADLWWSAVEQGLQLAPSEAVTAAAALGLEP